MKELTIEEKAKAYDKALNTAREILAHTSENYLCTHLTKEDIKEMYSRFFPELKESEDERIRTAIIHFISHTPTVPKGIIGKETMLAWLEKQGTPSKLSEEEQNRFAKGVLTSCAMSFINYLDAHKHEGKMCVSNGECEDIENAFQNAMWDRLHRYYCKYIEKQGEQKPIEWDADDDDKFFFLKARLKDYEDCIIYDEELSECQKNNVRETTKEFLEWLDSIKERIGG